jgi:predicted RNA-binding protein associated with RNAse of E/G family
MTCNPCQTALLKVGELLQALRSEQLSPEARVLARQAAASLHTASQHIVDQQARALLYEMPGRDLAKGESNAGD